jgi:epsilon-lactone hydrolase
MPSKQSEAVRRRWEASRLAMVQPGFEAPDDESWGDLTAEPRGVDYLETEAGGLPAMWAVPKRASTDRVLMCIHGGGFLGGSLYTHRKMFGTWPRRPARGRCWSATTCSPKACSPSRPMT